VALPWHYRILERGRRAGNGTIPETKETKKTVGDRKTAPDSRVGIIAEARKVLQYKAFADFDAIKIAF
jgi:hypothetical protein